MRRKAKAMVPPLQQAEFDALPDSVQRKYFSSLERLQIRQHSLDEQNASGCSSRASSSGQLCPSLTHHQHHHHAAPLAPRLLQLSQPEADFFLALPEKLRRLHFSRQEQVLLESSCTRRYHDDLERARQRFSDFRFGFSQQLDDNDDNVEADARADHRGRSRRRSLSHSSLVSRTQASFRSVAVQDEDLPSDASSCTDSWNRVLNQLDHIDGMTARPFKSTATSHDMRRTMSLSNAPVRHYTASSAMILGGPSAVLMADPPVYSTSSTTKHQRAHSSSFSMSGRSSLQTSTPPAVDPEATHYQDPEARRKLRMYLASPQKFDEAIEFGFPSSAENDAAAPHYQLPPITNHSRKFSRDMQTFLKDGKLSFLEEGVRENQGLDSDEEASVADADSPVTPSSTGHSFIPHSRQVSHSKMSSDGSPGFSSMAPSGCNFNREMTLRMTLTRPDLRADEDQLYGWQSPPNKTPKDDPLALEDLILTDDMNGTKGPFYVKPKPRENLVTRMLKRASWKGR